MVFSSVLRHSPNGLKNFSNFGNGCEGPKRKLFAHSGFKLVDKKKAPATPSSVVSACTDVTRLLPFLIVPIRKPG